MHASKKCAHAHMCVNVKTLKTIAHTTVCAITYCRIVLCVDTPGARFRPKERRAGTDEQFDCSLGFTGSAFCLATHQ